MVRNKPSSASLHKAAMEKQTASDEKVTQELLMGQFAKMRLAVSNPTDPNNRESFTTRESLPIRSLGGDSWGPSGSIDSEERLGQEKIETLFEKMRKSYQFPSGETGINATSGVQTLFEAFHSPNDSLIPRNLDTKSPNAAKHATILKDPEAYAEPFINFMTENPTVWHAIQYWENKLEDAGFSKVSATLNHSNSSRLISNARSNLRSTLLTISCL